jgi:hypothetical protein
MEQVATTSRSSRAPWGLTGMLVVVAAVEAFLGALDLVTTTHLVDAWTEAGVSAGSDNVRTSAILCLGDSQIQQGILPEGLGELAYSLAVQGGQPAAAEALLRRALAAGARPRAIVVGFFPGLLAADFKINLRQWPEILGPLGALKLAWTARDVDLAVKTGLGIALRSYRARAEIRAGIAAAVRGEPKPDVAGIVADRISRRTHRGALTLPGIMSFVDNVPVGPPRTSGPAWHPKPENDRVVRRLLSLAEARGIAVYWVTTTLSPGARAVWEHNNLHKGYFDYLRRLQGDFPGVTILDVADLELDASAFNDPCHLNFRAAARLTEAVARAIASDGGDRWVRLAPAGEESKLARGGTAAGPAR